MMIYFWFIRHPRNGANRSRRKDCGGFYVVARTPHYFDVGTADFRASQARKKSRVDRRSGRSTRGTEKSE